MHMSNVAAPWWLGTAMDAVMCGVLIWSIITLTKRAKRTMDEADKAFGGMGRDIDRIRRDLGDDDEPWQRES